MRNACRAQVRSVLLAKVSETEADQIAGFLYNEDMVATKSTNEGPFPKGLSPAQISAQALGAIAVELDQLDQQNERHEYRRDLLLRQIERRRSGWAKEVKRASEEVIDAEYSATPPSDFRPKDFSRAD
jgi:hypothetical protein